MGDISTPTANQAISRPTITLSQLRARLCQDEEKKVSSSSSSSFCLPPSFLLCCFFLVFFFFLANRGGGVRRGAEGAEGWGGVMRGEEGEGFFILFIYLSIFESTRY